MLCLHFSQGVPPSSYAAGKSIDLSTLLHKPTTQSSINSQSQQSLLQFTQQATDSLKAAVGIGQPPPPVSSTVSTNKNDYSSYASSAQQASSTGYGNSAFTSVTKQPQQSQPKVPVSSVTQRVAPPAGARQPAKIPNSAVEMPGDQLGR